MSAFTSISILFVDNVMAMHVQR